MIDKGILAVSSVLILVMSYLIYLLIREDQDWDKFKIEHECRVVEEKSPATLLLVGTNGKISIGSDGGSTGYACNDGVTYWR